MIFPSFGAIRPGRYIRRYIAATAHNG